MIKNLVNQFMLLIDSGKLLKKPFKWLYVLWGALSFVPLLVFLFFWIEEWDFSTTFLMDNFWGNFVSVFILILFAYTLALFAWIGFVFWINRKNNLDATVETGSRTVVIPLIADINQCIGEVNSIFLALVPSAAVILGYIACMLTNGFGFYTKVGILWMLLVIAAVIVISCLFAYLNLLFTRFVSERIRLVAQIGNDVHKLTITDTKETVREADKNDVKFIFPTISSKEKKTAIIALIVAVVVALGVATTQAIINHLAIGKSIYEELSYKQMANAEKKLDGFSYFYNETRIKCEVVERTEKFEGISYGQLYEYLNDYFGNEEFLEGVVEKANASYEEEIHSKVAEQVAAEKEKWVAFMEDHNPAQFLEIKAITSYHEYSSGWWNRYYYPAFYFEYTEPQGELSDASITFIPVNNEGRKNNSVGSNTVGLSHIKRYSNDFDKEWYTNVSDDSFWDKYHMEFTINSITTVDGKTISTDDLKDVPEVVMTYLDDPSEENELALIRSQIDENYLSRGEYVQEKMQEQLKQKDEACYEFMQAYYNRE